MQTYKERNRKLVLFFAIYVAFYGIYLAFNFPSFLVAPMFEKQADLFNLILFFVPSIAVAFAYGFLKGKRSRVSNVITSALVMLLLLLSCPSLFMVKSGYFLITVVVITFLWATLEDLNPNSVVSSAFLGLTASIIYPVYLIGIYFKKEQRKKLLTALGVAIFVLLGTFLVNKETAIGNIISLYHAATGYSGIADERFDTVYAICNTVGFTGFLGSLFKIIGMIPRGNVIRFLWLIFFVSFTVIGFVFLRNEKKLWKKILMITVLLIYLLPNSFLFNSSLIIAPVFLMLMDTEKLKKADVPYVIVSALLLVPKSYFIFDNWAQVPLTYNNVSIAVFLDGILYLGIIVYYFAQNFIVYSKEMKDVPEDRKTKLVLSSKALKIHKIIIIAVSLLFAAYVLYFVKDIVLACHDSMKDFIDARTNPFTKGFLECFKYGLARGRVGFIFPMVVAFRYLINGTGNYFAVWLLQYVPVYANIALLGFIIGKKIDKIYGFVFPICFLGLLQLDIWHNLIMCYPLDFMYGLFIMILGIYLYSEYLNRLSDKNSKHNIVRLIVSLVLYYESMQVYEAFIVSSLIYAVFSLNYAIKNSDKLKERIKVFVLKLLPHFIVAVVYLMILVYLRSHPVVDVPVSEFSGDFNLKRFLITYIVLSGGMFPLVDLRIVHGVFAGGISKRGIVLGITGAIGFIAAFRYGGAYYSSLPKTKRKNTNMTLGILALCGVLLAITFAIPHSLLTVYENWVVDDHTGGYVPTTICYFGWSLAIFAVVMLLSHYFSRIESKKRALVTLALAIAFACSIYLTSVINATFDDTVSSTGSWMSRRAQGFWVLLSDDGVKDLHPDMVYAPSMVGIHGFIGTNDELFDHELGYDADLLNDYSMFLEAYDNSENNMVMEYDIDAGVGFVAPVDYLGETYDECTSSRLYIVSDHSGEVVITYTLALEGEDVVVSDRYVIEGNGLTEIMVDNSFVISSVDIER